MKSKKVLVIGSHGLLGSTLVKLLKDKNYEVYTSDISDKDGIDITKPESVEKQLEKTKPDFVVNCAAYTNVEACEDLEQYKIAYAVNADGPKNLAHECRNRNINFIHISTDYVFGDNDEDGYEESHRSFNPLNKYGETKLAGEKNIEMARGCIEGSDYYSQSPLFYVVRTSALFGEGATNFIAKIMQYAKEKEFLEVVTDEIVSPTYVKDLSEGIIYLIEYEPKGGVYHYSGEGSCTRNEFAKEILKLAGIDTPVKPTTLDKFNRKAKIPNVSILKNTKFPEIRGWKEMLAEFMTR
ncbi:dTDP-4-dehydrorhamnose reductase [Candidatus Dojkabacteria bacterium]|jgi:dTDP-4-dehydrorhamnose reductase|uniref:dTDP-4-dehydrorhamnose reductase n=1 Tax=Candidatus Dojkabacteria bacterium TaxID=2099670 RepID=A0A955L0G2_9BACT|nr:dTDP-4-dehydrorhamnose reductase [Candidatus Dojkabacteria bacterium]